MDPTELGKKAARRRLQREGRLVKGREAMARELNAVGGKQLVAETGTFPYATGRKLAAAIAGQELCRLVGL